MRGVDFTEHLLLLSLILQDAHNKIIKDREAQAKQARAKEAREKQERERAERAEKRRQFVDFNQEGDQEGVMDSLLEALKTGSAFNRDQKRKRAPRAAGGESLFFCINQSLLYTRVGQFNLNF